MDLLDRLGEAGVVGVVGPGVLEELAEEELVAHGALDGLYQVALEGEVPLVEGVLFALLEEGVEFTVFEHLGNLEIGGVVVLNVIGV